MDLRGALTRARRLGLFRYRNPCILKPQITLFTPLALLGFLGLLVWATWRTW